MYRAILVALLLSGWVPAASAQKRQLIDEPVDRPTAWTNFWIPSTARFTARFVADGSEVTLDFRAQLHKTFPPNTFMDQAIDNVSLVKGTVFDALFLPVVTDSFPFLFNQTAADMFYFHDVPASDRIFLDTFAAAANPGWDTSQGAFFADTSVDPFGSSAPNDLRAPSNDSGGWLALGRETDTSEFASTNITIGGLAAGVEYVLDFWWRSAADDTNGVEVEGPIFFVQVLGSESVLVSFDIRPEACTNRLNVRAGGMLPAAILGSPSFDVQQVDLASLRLLGSVVPVRGGYQDVGRPAAAGGQCACSGPLDGTGDLVLKFRTQDVVALLGPVANGDVRELALTGRLNDGRPLAASDCIVLTVPGGPHLASSAVPDGRLEVSGGPRGARRIAYALAEAAHVRLTVYDVAGRVSQQLVDSMQPAGAHESWWDPAPLPNGVYFVRLEAAGRAEVTKTVVVQ